LESMKRGDEMKSNLKESFRWDKKGDVS
jgi:hypothetical protein